MKIFRSISRIAVVGCLIIAAVVATLAITPAWAGNGQGKGPVLSVTPLSLIQAAELQYMREEEKLARDVYLFMYEKWGAAIFTNIAASEQTHMDTLLGKLVKYGIPDLALEAEGDFFNPVLQDLYNDLVDKGDDSYQDALEVGVIIEELDMIDLAHAIDLTADHIDVVRAYQNLLAGSINHLEAFEGALDALDK